MPLTLSGTYGVSGIDGSNTTPAVRGGTSSSNGVFYGTNTVSIATNSTTAVTVDSSQRVGIGTSSPAFALDVVSSSDMAGRFSTIGSNNAASFYLSSGNGTTSGKYAYARFLNNDTNQQEWRLGTYGTDNFSLYDAKASATRLTVDTSGNLGLGVTPSAWRSTNPAFQIGYAGVMYGYSASTITGFGSNVYLSAVGNYTYINNATATLYLQNSSGLHQWFTASAGTGTITGFNTPAMTLDASGNLGIGETSPSTYGQLVVKGGSSSATSPVLALVANSFLGADGPALDFARAGFTQPIQARIRTEDDGTASSNLSFWTKNTGTAGTLTRRMTLDASGNLAVGGSTANSRLDVQGGYLRVNEDGVGTKVITLRSNYASVAPAINVTTNDPLLLMTNNTERARIDTNGTLLVGQTTNPATSSVVIKVVTGTGNGVNAQITSNTGTSYPWSNYNASGTYVGGISCTSSATAFPTSSDERLKSNIVDAENTLTTLLSIKVRSFNWKIDNSHQDYGVIAQEVAPLVPEAVLVSPGPDDYLSVDYSRFVPRLVKAIQELAAKVQALEAKVA